LNFQSLDKVVNILKFMSLNIIKKRFFKIELRKYFNYLAYKREDPEQDAEQDIKNGWIRIRIREVKKSGIRAD